MLKVQQCPLFDRRTTDLWGRRWWWRMWSPICSQSRFHHDDDFC